MAAFSAVAEYARSDAMSGPSPQKAPVSRPLWHRIKTRSKHRINVILGKEIPKICEIQTPVEYFGGPINGWGICANSLHSGSIVYSCGVGADTTFDEAIIDRFGCTVFGFDPTPGAAEHVKHRKIDRFRLVTYGIGGTTRDETFYMPKVAEHVSGSVMRSDHLADEGYPVQLKCIKEIMTELGHQRVDVLKLDIEGTEYEVVDHMVQEKLGDRIDQLLIEFHHRFSSIGIQKTRDAMAQIRQMGFLRAWTSDNGTECLFIKSAPPFRHP